MRPRKTAKQREIMGLVLRAAGEGKFLTLTDIHNSVSYGKDCTYAAIRLSVGLLAKQGFVEKQKLAPEDQRLNSIVPTTRGYDWFRPAL